ncbi:hypothetical protein VSS37_13255 [Candidatus Thiothrix sp. Deng01]|uniref:Tetratricopeptide repeat protein n=1 Tax=Candidatus Thiothrix phosphatis TaxID=3112415 RepID=A0ABU6CYP9_9GAMM|nr:hypothetical protein [Candidatus Thiothrix sp. Deng01]MEB4591954.1 hypothetical protein [Candidatus Thiothrix sp. Deng01]
MTPRFRNSFAASLVAASLLSACSPNPYVLQDRVYGSTPAPVTPVAPPGPSVSKPAIPSSTSTKAKNKKSVPSKQKEITRPEIVTTPQKEVEAVPETPVTPKAYQSSPAVQSLVKQADSALAIGDMDKAASTIERALRIESDNPDLWMKLSAINESQGHHEQAASMADKAKVYQEQLN